MQDCVNSNKIKENKYKILRMSLLLGSGVDREDTFNNFEDAAREIDAMNDEIYLKNIEDKFYDTLNLEEEEKKLTVLVDYIGGRVEQRISLLSDFANVTGYDLQNLPSIKYYDKLDDYKERLSYIREYLGNIAQIDVLNDEIEQADKKLNEAYLNRASSEEHNKKIENTLLDKFTGIFKTLDFFEGVTDTNVDEKLNEVIYKVEDSKKSLDIFTKSFTTLSGSGISLEEEKEYLSYVENAKYAYYSYKEQEYVLRLYKLLLSKFVDYNQILYKREEINDILYDRLKLRKELKISNTDSFNNVYDLLERQYDDIKRQSIDIENIEKLTNKINNKKAELNRLEIENQKVEILSLLREFGIIDTFEEDNETLDVEINDNNVSDVVTSDEINDNDFVFDEVSISEDLGNDLEISNDVEINLFDTEDKIDDIITTESNEVIEVNNKVDDVVEEPEVIQDDALDNQVILVEDAKLTDLDLIHSKANKVMKRVGEMLGIKVEEVEIVNVSSADTPEEKNIFMNEDAVVEENKISEPVVEENKISEPVVEENPFMANPLFGTEIENEEKNSEDEEDTLMNNPLFSGIDTMSENDIATTDSSFDAFSFSNNSDSDFWFSSETPDALNELPDLNVSNDDFFANNNVADLAFPDLNMGFPDDDMEEKI